MAFLDGELVRTTEALDPGTLRGQAQTFEAHRPDRERARGFLSHPDGDPPYAWVVGDSADFDLDVLDPVDRRLRLDIASGLSGPQQVTVAFNGTPLGEGAIEPPGPAGLPTSLFFDVPAALQREGSNRVDLGFARTESRQLVGEPWPLPIAAVLKHVRFREPERIEELPGHRPDAGLLTEPLDGRPAAVLVVPEDTEARASLRLPAATRVVLRFTLLESPLPLDVSVATEDGRRWLLQSFGPDSPMPAEVRHDLTPWAGRAVQVVVRARSASAAAPGAGPVPDGTSPSNGEAAPNGAAVPEGEAAPNGAGDAGGQANGAPASGQEDTGPGGVAPGDALPGDAAPAVAPARSVACRITGANILVPEGDPSLGSAARDTARAPEPLPGKPSFLVVTLDACSRAFTGIERNGRPVTPHLDALATRGVLFDNALAPASYTLASVASLLTGQTAFTHGMAQVMRDGRLARLAPDAPSLPGALRDAGWKTVAWMTNPNGGAEFGYDRGFERFERLYDDPSLWNEGVAGEELPPRFEGFLADAGRAPFLAWVHVFQPHAPYLAPPDLTEAFVAPYTGRASGLRGFFDGVRKGEWRPSPEDWEHVRQEYTARVAYADRILGELLDALARSGRGQDTVVVVLSDHGEAFGRNGAVEHGDFVTQAELQVPLVVVVPGRPPVRRAAPVSLVDLAPTLLGLAGLPVPRAMEGRDLFAEASSGPRTFFARSAQLAPNVAILRDGKKLVVDLTTRRRQLFNLDDDPTEQTDLTAREPVTAAVLLRELTTAVCAGEMGVARRGPADDGVLDEERMKQLEGIGYGGTVRPSTSVVPDQLPVCTLLRSLQRRL